MDDQTRQNGESDSASRMESPSYTGAFFPHARHLVVAGGTFTSNNTITSPPAGDDAEEDWKETVSVHANLRPVRHPHILQIYATASSSGIYAAVFHDDLIPLELFLQSFRHSAILQTYIHAYMSADEDEALDYCGPTADSFFTTPWVRRSTGRLCLEFGTMEVDDKMPIPSQVRTLTPPDSIQTLHDLNKEAWVIASLALEQWYSLCHQCLTQDRRSDISVQAKVKVGSIIHWPSNCQFEDATEIPCVIPDRDRLVLAAWYHERLGRWKGDGPIWYTCRDIFGSIISTGLSNNVHARSWLSQANYIFKQLEILSNYNDYVLVDWVLFSVYIPFPRQNPPDGYLFICSPTDFHTGGSSVRWPDRPAYWSLYPSGSEPLSVEEASRLGFPPIQLTTRIGVKCWDETVYTGVRKFHAAKGFDPDSQDVARELGYLLYELSVPTSETQEQDSGTARDNQNEHPSSYREFVQDDPLEPIQEFSCSDKTVIRHCTFGELVELVKLGLIGVLILLQLYEHPPEFAVVVVMLPLLVTPLYTCPAPPPPFPRSAGAERQAKCLCSPRAYFSSGRSRRSFGERMVHGSGWDAGHMGPDAQGAAAPKRRSHAQW
ncbi:hypothetical protein MSAN_01703400 [Mycena sanguinolenta]|uniref:Uncharacterized protein n=1 Tax=Mycena sanguinolenta TaxID=230812 RepID=A0A8H6Y0U0_9AGAR|nr:hypothetical protein MSAN_01703400 [Mycena sanguinolenta]